MKYKIYKRKKRLKATVTYAKKKPYVFNPAYRKSEDIVDIGKLSLYNDYMTNNILVKKYIRRYKNLLKLAYLVFNDEIPSGEGVPSVLGEIDKLRALLNDKYRKYLEQEKFKLFLKELDFIEKEINKFYIERVFLEQQMLSNTNFIR